VALVLMAVWAFIMGYLMWRNGSRSRIRRTQSATPQAPPTLMVRQSLGPQLLRVLFLLYASIHRSAWKGNSAKFAMAVVLCGVDTYSVAYDMFSRPPLGGRQEYKKQ
jgi:hypothetical protein